MFNQSTPVMAGYGSIVIMRRENKKLHHKATVWANISVSDSQHVLISEDGARVTIVLRKPEVVSQQGESGQPTTLPINDYRFGAHDFSSWFYVLITPGVFIASGLQTETPSQKRNSSFIPSLSIIRNPMAPVPALIPAPSRPTWGGIGIGLDDQLGSEEAGWDFRIEADTKIPKGSISTNSTDKPRGVEVWGVGIYVQVRLQGGIFSISNFSFQCCYFSLLLHRDTPFRILVLLTIK
jgi:hypothetical protein